MNTHRAALATLLCSLTVAGLGQNLPSDKSISLTVRTPTQMAPADADALTAHASAIARAASFYGYTVDSSWSYRQVVCPLAPQHLLLSYRQSSARPQATAGMDNASSFSAIVPRQGGVVRIVPLARQGTAPFVTPWGEHSYDVFNTIIDGGAALQRTKLDVAPADPARIDPAATNPFLWGLCYVALVGEEGVVRDPDHDLHVLSATEPTVRVGAAGEIALLFTVQDDPLGYSIWQLDFSSKGALIHADRDRHELHPVSGLQAAVAASLNVPAATGAAPAVSVTPSSEAVASPGQPAPVEGRPVPEDPAPAGKPVPDSGPAATHPVPQR